MDLGVIGRSAVVPLARAGAATVALFLITGFGLTRLLLPEGLRAHEALWVLPIGACATGLTMTVLGFLAVPFDVNLGLVLLAGVALGVVALRRRPISGRAGALAQGRAAAWPVWVAGLVIAVALVPLFRAGFATVAGQGQDAHLAVGSAMFLQENYPTSVDPAGPVDQMPLVWRSKQPIYYALGSAARLSGLEVFETISTVAAVLLGLAALGFFLFTREVLGAPRWAALAAMGLVGVDRMVLHTVMHPYFNQTWGFMAMPFALVLSWWVVRERSRGGIVLLVMFLALLAFAYPLALPIPLVPVAVVLWPHRRRLRELRRLYRGTRSLVWIVPLGLVFMVPLLGVLEKTLTAVGVIFDLSRGLQNWGGDLDGWFMEPWFFGIQTWAFAAIVLVPVAFAVWLGLRDQPAALRRGLYGLFAFSVAFTVLFRLRDYGWYFHFKILAFVAPVVLAVAAAGFARLRRPALAYLALGLLLVSAVSSARTEIGRTFDQLPRFVLELRSVDAALPPGRSVRLDIDPQEQNWAAFWLHGQPLCSRRPLLNTSYPHVPISRKADYVLTKNDAPAPADAAEVVMRIQAFTLYRQRAGVPGRSACSQLMVQTIERVTG
ncbi:MAG: hypothetical protein M3417_08645 [Actinomycetota bacterium]|nr:hypothetical protein [Actinomycetota bacterium]